MNGGFEISLFNLLIGEKVLMLLVLVFYNICDFKGKFDLLLIDEFDVVLYLLMIKKMVLILKKNIVEDNNILVVIIIYFFMIVILVEGVFIY